MKILVISNFYPPHFIGGYEIGCEQVTDGLRAAGHEVRVLTSSYGCVKPTSGGHVYRLLPYRLPGEAWRPVRRIASVLSERAAISAWNRVTASFRPDVVYVWNLGFISPAPVIRAERLGIPTCYYVFDPWVQGWPATHGVPDESLSPLRKQVLRLLLGVAGTDADQGKITPQVAQYASQYLKDLAHAGGHTPAREWVVPFGIYPRDFPRGSAGWPPTRLLFIGHIAEHKGVHVAVEAFCLLARECVERNLRLTIAGGTLFPSYLADLQARVRVAGLEGRVEFLGSVGRADIPALYARHDVLLFPSVWDEPFGITPLEAMASGLVVVTSATGGSGEFLRDEQTALVFPRGDAAGCAKQLIRLAEDQDMFARLQVNGAHLVETELNLDRVIPVLEAGLREVAAAGRGGHAAGRPL